jgi:Tfp pilus assembly protein FimT
MNMSIDPLTLFALIGFVILAILFVIAYPSLKQNSHKKH